MQQAVPRSIDRAEGLNILGVREGLVDSEGLKIPPVPSTGRSRDTLIISNPNRSVRIWQIRQGMYTKKVGKSNSKF